MDSHIDQTTTEERSDHIFSPPAEPKYKRKFSGKFFPLVAPLTPPTTVNVVAETYDL